MRAVFGLGNPGERYSLTRHNAGFILLDYFANQHKLTFKPGNKNYLCAKGEFANSPFVVIKPITFMNNCGFAVMDIVEKYNLSIEDLLVCYDDIYLENGQIRIRQSGGTGGHNGLESIFYHLNTNKIHRLRIGVGFSQNAGGLSNYVLEKFSNDEINNLEPTLKLCSSLIEEFIISGIKGMLDRYSKFTLEKKT